MAGSLPVGTRRNYGAELCKYCGNRTADRLTTDAGASDDAIPGDAGANPNGGDASGGDASPSDGDAIAGASDAPSGLVRA